MANPSMRGKVDKAKRQTSEAARNEFHRSMYATIHQTITPSDVDAMVEAYLANGGEVSKCPRGRYRPEPGKGGRSIAKRCYGDGTRQWTSPVYKAGPTLIKG